MKWNEAQLSAIKTREKNILVSAAAGSGKTAVLTERIKQLVTKEGVDISEMLIVTFTNAAAAEMRERIYIGIAAAMDEDGADVFYLQDQLDKLGSANISTFHAFCLEVIRNYFYMTELSPDFKICDDAQSEILSQESMEILINEFFEAKDKAFLNYVSRYSKAGNEKGISSMILMLYRFIQSIPNPAGWLEEKIEELRDSTDVLEKGSYDDALVLKRMVLRYDEIFKERKRASDLVDFNDVEHLALEILNNPEPCNEYREKFRHIFIDEYQDTNAIQEELISRIKRDNNVFMVGDVKQSIYQFRLADPEIFIEKYKTYREGSDENSVKIDLNRNFRSKTPVLETTNLIMREIMQEETCGIDYDEASQLYQGINYDGTEYENLQTEAVELHVLVEEDVKKSLEEKIEQGAQLRGSESKITEDVDAQYGNMTPDGQITWNFESSGDIKERWPELRTIKSSELEAMYISGYIKELLGKEFYDTKEGRIKKVTYKDIVILMRSYRSVSEVYQDVFQRSGIPSYVEGGDGYFETTEIAVFANLLRIIVNKRQDIPFLSVMRSIIFKFSSDDFAKIRSEFRTGLFSEGFIEYAQSGKNSELKEKCALALRRLEEWRELSQYLSLKDFMWRIAEDSGFYSFVQGLPMGAVRKENIKRLINKAEEYQSNTAKGLPSFVNYIEQLEMSAAAIPDSAAETLNKDVVRIMSIHKSKGLEFPVVIIAGAGKRFNHRKPSAELSLDKNLGVGLRFKSKGNDYYVKTEKQQDIDEEVKRKEIAEEMRVLYVAMTRAKEKLVIVGSVKKLDADKIPGEDKDVSECNSYLEWLCEPMSHITEQGNYELMIDREYPWELQAHQSTNDIDKKGAARDLVADNKREHESSVKSEQEEVAVSLEFDSPEDNLLRDEIYRELNYEYAFWDAAIVPAKFTATEINRMMRNLSQEEKEEMIPVPGLPTEGNAFTENKPYEIDPAYLEETLSNRGDGKETAYDSADDSESSAHIDLDGDSESNAHIDSAGDSESGAHIDSDGALRLKGAKASPFSAAERGTIVHTVMEKLDLSQKLTLKNIKEQVKHMEESGKLPSGAAKIVPVRKLYNFLNGELGIRLLNAKAIYREKPFMLWKEFDTRTGSVVQGIIDCFFEESDGMVLVDYKTDYIPPGATEKDVRAKAGEYDYQIKLYKEAIEESTGKKVKEAYLYFINSDKAVNMIQ